MSHLTRVAAVAAAALLAIPGGTAHAAQNAGYMAGNGFVSPGFPCPSSGCVLHMDFSVLVEGPDVSGLASCTFDGYDNLPGTLLAGSGGGTISCSGGISASGVVGFVRTAAVTAVNGNLVVNGHPATLSGQLAFVPTGNTEFVLTGPFDLTI